MGEQLHLVQRGGAWAGRLPINGQCTSTNHRIAV